MKDAGDFIKFLKQKDYVMINNHLGRGAFGETVLLKDPYIDELFVAKKYCPLGFIKDKNKTCIIITSLSKRIEQNDLEIKTDITNHMIIIEDRFYDLNLK